MRKKIMISFFMLSTVLCVFSIPTADDGKLIFTSRCASCHNVNKVVLGPALAGVTDRHSQDWIIKFVHSSQAVIKSGDKTAVTLYEKFNKIPMPDHPDLSTENIQSILAYIKSETQTSVVTRAFIPNIIHPAYTPILVTNYKFFAAYLGLVLLMTVSLLALVKVKEIQRNKSDDQLTIDN
jgi:cytochrome c551/c552